MHLILSVYVIKTFNSKITNKLDTKEINEGSENHAQDHSSYKLRKSGILLE